MIGARAVGRWDKGRVDQYVSVRGGDQATIEVARIVAAKLLITMRFRSRPGAVPSRLVKINAIFRCRPGGRPGSSARRRDASAAPVH